MATTWAVYVDKDDDGTFSAGDNLATYVRAVKWRIGVTPYEFLERGNFARILLNNFNGAVSPETSTLGLVPGRPVRIQSNDGTLVRSHFTGHIWDVEWVDQQTIAVNCRTQLEAIQQQVVTLPLAVSQRSDQVIQAVIDRLKFRQPALGTGMIIGTGLIGTGTLFGPPLTVNVDSGVGKYTFNYVGDSWAAGVPAERALREVLEVEAGYLYTDGSGTVRFKDRSILQNDPTTDAIFDNTVSDFEYSYGDQVVNSVEVRFRPRKVGTANSVLWTSTVTHEFRAQSVKELLTVFRNSVDNFFGALSVVYPPSTSDFVFYDGSGNDVSTQVRVNVVSEGSRAKVRVENPRVGSVFLQANSVLRGTPLVQGNEVVAVARNALSETVHGPRMVSLSRPLMNSLEDAQQLAGYELLRRGLPRGIMKSVTIRATALEPHKLGRTVLDRITVRDARLSHARDYFIMAENHELEGDVHVVRWELELAASERAIVIGIAKVGDLNVVIGY